MSYLLFYTAFSDTTKLNSLEMTEFVHLKQKTPNCSQMVDIREQ